MSSLLQQTDANNTDKPELTKYGHTAPGALSGLDENPAVSAAKKPQGRDEGGATKQAKGETGESESKAEDPKRQQEQKGNLVF
ncbi:hypothetical protein SLS62_010489 [Diatrype stigma]|uniref:Uncharacterized protein n=1 Tax=Diatrype stigma TaxID=117547 RepID=A0AAN9U9F2_9PEZI